MIIVNMTGQLGNQMFQYAIYRKLALQGKNVKMDMSYYTAYPQHNMFYIFDLDIRKATRKEVLTERDEFRSYMDRIRRKFLGRRKNIISEINADSYNYNPTVFETKRGYIDGYWQSEKYFSDIKDQLIADFKFPAISDERNTALLEYINEINSISIHIRRGDYAGGFPMLSKDYYDRAIHYLTEYNRQCVFFVFSNDMVWAKENICAENVVFVDWNTGNESWKDMCLMAQCKHNIIANSSFSWWGAWLNKHKNKQVIAPKQWFYHAQTPDIYCDDWIII